MLTYYGITWRNWDDNSKMVFLLRRQTEFLSNITNLVGQRREEYILLDIIEKKFDGPGTYYPGTSSSLKFVTIRLTNHAFSDYSSKLAEWQLAHECFHLMDPSRDTRANFLEEGLASWYQMNIKNNGIYLNVPAYITAKETVQRYIHNNDSNQTGDILSAVKNLRNDGAGKRISEITSQDLMTQVTNISSEDADLLASEFPRQR